MPVPPIFEIQFENYRQRAVDAQDRNLHHDQRRELFLEFIQRAFQIDAADIQREEAIALTQVERRGWIDALFDGLVFEFKRDLEKERETGLRELRDYLGHLREGERYIGLLSDGLKFEAYVLKEKELDKTDQIDLGQLDAEQALLWLDAYLFSQRNLPPSAADLVRRFGANSPTFQRAAGILDELLRTRELAPSIQAKQDQWRRLLTRVYGSDLTTDELFIRHTYLAQFAKVLAYAARNGGDRSIHDLNTLEQIVDGRAFNRLGFENVADRDFFGWVLETEVRTQALKVLSGLASSLVVYDLSQINEDLFKQLYQNLVDPHTRHDLGEYYTPDWLAELTLREIEYKPGQSLLDPSCGSGTFLFSAIKRLEAQGLEGWDLVNFAAEHVMGLDIHPLAVTVARINYTLALLPHMRGDGGPMRGGQPHYGFVAVPIFNANALPVTETLGGNGTAQKGVDVFSVPVDSSSEFKVPVEAARQEADLLFALQQMEVYASEKTDSERPFVDFDTRVIVPRFGNGGFSPLRGLWGNNYRLLRELIRSRRNGIWAYVLKNYVHPLIFMQRRFDVVAGNPPWLSYGFIKDPAYQAEVRKMMLNDFQLLESSDTQLFTRMDLSTLFYAFCEKHYLKVGGVIAFVMPRSVITGAKQHLRFQARGFSRVIDLKDVEPLFNVEAAVVISRDGEARGSEAPTLRLHGKLPRHEMTLAEADPYLKRAEGAFKAHAEAPVKGPYYYDKFKQGATLVPRTLIFARPQAMPGPQTRAYNPLFETDILKNAKEPWKDLRLEGYCDQRFLFSSLLGENLLPFGVRAFNLVILPLQVGEDGRPLVTGYLDVRSLGHKQTSDVWFEPAEKLWEQHSKHNDRISSFLERIDYQGSLSSQRVKGVVKVLYNKSGTNISAVVLDLREKAPIAYRYPTQGFIAEMVTYYSETDDPDEAHFLAALLNAPCVDDAIKPHQTRGIYKGARDITRRMFEHTAIPAFDANNKDHQRLAALSQEAHAAVAALDMESLGATAGARAAARKAAAKQIEEIDAIAQRLLGL